MKRILYQVSSILMKIAGGLEKASFVLETKSIDLLIKLGRERESPEEGRPRETLWGVFRSGMDVHVIPIDDIKEHTFDANCPCGPDAEIIGAGIKYLHHSWDLRELFEEVEEILNGGEDML